MRPGTRRLEQPARCSAPPFAHHRKCSAPPAPTHRTFGPEYSTFGVYINGASPASGWHIGIVAVDSAGYATTYLDGTQSATQLTGGSGTNGPIRPAPFNFVIGVDFRDNALPLASGTAIAVFAVFPYVMSSSEVRAASTCAGYA